MLIKSIFLLFLFGIISDQINCYYYGYDQQAENIEQKALDLLASDLLKSELDEKTINQPTYEQSLVQVQQDHGWKLKKDVLKRLGEISGVAVDEYDNVLYIFHRGNRVWNAETDLFQLNEPIKQDAVVMINATDSTFIGSWGSNMFYMPHGISVDKFGNVWLTDVVTHQVYRFKKGHFKAPQLVLGKQFKAGTGEQFCMPTSVAVGSNYVYISDGYCNSRIAIYSLSGLYLDQIAYKDGINIPHSLTLLEDEDLICVADREGRRLLCYTAGLTPQKAGKLLFSVKHPSMKRVFAITSVNDLIFGINGPELDGFSSRSNKDQQIGFVLNLATERLLNSFYPTEGFESPHDLTVNRKTGSLFVSDLKSKNKIFKFNFFIRKN